MKLILYQTAHRWLFCLEMLGIIALFQRVTGALFQGIWLKFAENVFPASRSLESPRRIE